MTLPKKLQERIDEFAYLEANDWAIGRPDKKNLIMKCLAHGAEIFATELHADLRLAMEALEEYVGLYDEWQLSNRERKIIEKQKYVLNSLKEKYGEGK